MLDYLYRTTIDNHQTRFSFSDQIQYGLFFLGWFVFRVLQADVRK
jgi:hypothetical protein